MASLFHDHHRFLANISKHFKSVGTCDLTVISRQLGVFVLLTCTFIIEIYYKFIIFVMLLFSEPSGMLVYNIL